jgi:hypothetical protein
MKEYISSYGFPYKWEGKVLYIRHPDSTRWMYVSLREDDIRALLKLKEEGEQK